jgi:hypothetical protein
MAQNIENFFSKYKSLESDEQKIKKSILLLILKYSHLEIDQDLVTIKKNTIYIDLHPIRKQQVLRLKTELLRGLQSQSWNIIDIK